MKRSDIYAALTGVVLGLLLVYSGCVGTKARENVLMPAMSQAYKHTIRPNIEAAPEAVRPSAEALDAYGVLLDSRNVDHADELRRVWVDLLLPAFQAGVQAKLDANKIGPNGALIIFDTGRQFELSLLKLGGAR